MGEKNNYAYAQIPPLQKSRIIRVWASRQVFSIETERSVLLALLRTAFETLAATLQLISSFPP